MTCYQKHFTSFQREVITNLETLLGDRASEYTKNNNNHMQIKVEGIDRVFHSAATPSDYRALDNVIGQIRAALKRLNTPSRHPKEAPQSQKRAKAKECATELVAEQVHLLKKQLKTDLRSIRRQEFKMQTQQQDAQGSALSSTQLAESIRRYRKSLIADPLEQAVHQARGTLFIPPGLLKQGKTELETFLNSHLDTLAEYRARLDRRLQRRAADVPHSPQATDVTPDSPCKTGIQSKSEAEKEDIDAVKAKKKLKQKKTKQPPCALKQNPVADSVPAPTVTPEMPAQGEWKPDPVVLMNETEAMRIQGLQALSKLQIRQLMDNCQQALHQKHQSDIAYVANEMLTRGVTLQELEPLVVA